MMANNFNRCFTPTSLWQLFAEGSGEYRIVVQMRNERVVDSIKPTSAKGRRGKPQSA